MSRFIILVLLALFSVASAGETEADALPLFARDNLVAWCIVPFDAKKRGPEERAAMLEKIGITKIAYDWRDEHIPTFDKEVECLKARKIELLAWWFPNKMTRTAKKILEVLKRHDQHPQLWTVLGQPTGTTQEEKVANAVKAIRPVAEKILPVGSGEDDLAMLKTVQASGWRGPIPVKNMGLCPKFRDFQGMGCNCSPILPRRYRDFIPQAGSDLAVVPARDWTVDVEAPGVGGNRARPWSNRGEGLGAGGASTDYARVAACRRVGRLRRLPQDSGGELLGRRLRKFD